MGKINLYKIDENKQQAFLREIRNKYEFIGEQTYNVANDENHVYVVGTYVNVPEEIKPLEWQWVLDEYEFEVEEMAPMPRAVIIIEDTTTIYAITYGLSYFLVDKYCDIDFAFDFARRIKFKQIKTTTLTAPNAQRNKMINTYLNYHDLSFDSGESFAKIKAKVENKESKNIHGALMEIGHSIKTQLLDESIQGILEFIEYVQEISAREELHKIPVFCKIKDEMLIQELDERLVNGIEADCERINISELDIVGATEVLNNNDASYVLKYQRRHMNIQELTKESILKFVEDNNFDMKSAFLNIKVVSIKDGQTVRTDILKKLIDYTDDEKRCLLLKGEWYAFNDDYIQYLQDSIEELDVIYNPKYDFSDEKLEIYVNQKYKKEKNDAEYQGLTDTKIRKHIKDKYYAERVFNNSMSENFEFENYDRKNDETGAGRIELMDLYKDGVMYAVKIGESSAKLSYAVEQSISSTRMYKHHYLSNMPKVDTIAVWIVLKRNTHLPIINGKPNLSSLKMIMLKNRLDSWKKEVRMLGYKPVVYLNYWSKK